MMPALPILGGSPLKRRTNFKYGGGPVRHVPFATDELRVLEEAVGGLGTFAWDAVAAHLSAHGYPGRTAMGCQRCSPSP